MLEQLEQLDLLAPWPALSRAAGAQRIRLLVRIGVTPIGEVLLENALDAPNLRNKLTEQLTWPLLQAALDAGLAAGPDALHAGHALHVPLLADGWAGWEALMRDALLDPRGIQPPFRDWFSPAPAPSLPAATIAICTADRPDKLESCLRACLSQNHPQFTVIVADNSQRDPAATREACARFGVEYLRVPQRGGSIAHNAALAAANTGWIAFTDDDCFPEPEWLRQLHLAALECHASCVTGLTLPASIENEAQLTFEEYGGFSRGFRPRIFDQAFFRTSRVHVPPTWRIGGGGNMLIDRSLAISLGGYDTDLGPGRLAATGEDIDIFYKVLRAGRSVHYTPRAVLRHAHRTTPEALQRQILGYARGHSAYHWRCLWRYGDLRALLHLLFFLPKSMFQRWRDRRCGRSAYPAKLLRVEARGMLMGPIHYSAARLKTFFRSIFSSSSQRAAGLAGAEHSAPEAKTLRPPADTMPKPVASEALEPRLPAPQAAPPRALAPHAAAEPPAR